MRDHHAALPADTCKKAIDAAKRSSLREEGMYKSLVQWSKPDTHLYRPLFHLYTFRKVSSIRFTLSELMAASQHGPVLIGIYQNGEELDLSTLPEWGELYPLHDINDFEIPRLRETDGELQYLNSLQVDYHKQVRDYFYRYMLFYKHTYKKGFEGVYLIGGRRYHLSGQEDPTTLSIEVITDVLTSLQVSLLKEEMSAAA